MLLADDGENAKVNVYQFISLLLFLAILLKEYENSSTFVYLFFSSLF